MPENLVFAAHAHDGYQDALEATQKSLSHCRAMAAMTPVLTTEEAVAKHGADAITVHKSTWVNMLYSREFLVEGQFMPKTMAKLICIGPEQRIIGLHMIGLAVDEILQGFGVAIKMGATKADFDSAVAIHPTSAEELVTIPPWQAQPPWLVLPPQPPAQCL